MSVVADKLAELTQRFIHSLPARTEAIAETFASARRDAGNRARTRELNRHLHALAGTAATYGVMEVAALAREAESLCDEPCEVVAFDALGDLIGRIRAAVEHA